LLLKKIMLENIIAGKILKYVIEVRGLKKLFTEKKEKQNK